METRHLTCINCPLGCALTVEMENGVIQRVQGNTCPRGDVYARKEVTHPTRIVTSTIRVLHGSEAMVSVKTQKDIDKEKIGACMKAIRHMQVEAPVHMGDCLLDDVAGTHVAIIATKQVERK